MGCKLEITARAHKDFKRLPPDISQRIILKLEMYASLPKPLAFAKPLKNRDSEWRFRVGDYRVIVLLKQGVIFILQGGHRKDIYES